jgi:hypothetical protein
MRNGMQVFSMVRAAPENQPVKQQMQHLKIS